MSSPFQVAGCASLPFAPKLTASAGGHGSKADGTSLHVTVTSAGLGQANIAKVDLQLPLALSSRAADALQRACTEATFNANPASGNEDAVIGDATIHTPVLKNPVSGPAVPGLPRKRGVPRRRVRAPRRRHHPRAGRQDQHQRRDHLLPL